MSGLRSQVVRRWATWRAKATFSFGGLRIDIPDGVLNPTLMRSSLFFAEACADSVKQVSSDSPSPRVLELGCGGGLASLLATKAGGRVLAIDCDARAIAATNRNAEQNALRLHTLVSDWDQALAPDCRFDRVLLNPPFLQQELRNDSDQWLTRALVSGPRHEHLESALDAAARRLAPKGRAVLLTSERSGTALVNQLIGESRLAVNGDQTRKIQGERFILNLLSHSR